jgi:hypothetical protein
MMEKLRIKTPEQAAKELRSRMSADAINAEIDARNGLTSNALPEQLKAVARKAKTLKSWEHHADCGLWFVAADQKITFGIGETTKGTYTIEGAK